MDAFMRGGIFRGRQVSVIDLPREARDVVRDELPLVFGAGKIEALIRQAEERGGSIDLGPPAAAELALMMTHEVGRYQVERVYWSAGTGVLCGVVELHHGRLDVMTSRTFEGAEIEPWLVQRDARQKH